MTQERADLSPQAGRPASLTSAQARQVSSTSADGQVKPDIAYEIKGEVSQYVEIKLRPGQSLVGEITALMYYEAGISMKMRTAAPTNEKNGFLYKFLSLGKAALRGETLFMMYFTNTSKKELIVAFSMPYSGTIVPIDLASVGKTIICQNDCFVCSSVDVRMSTASPSDLGGNVITSSIAMQKIEGAGKLFLFCGGNMVQKNIIQGSQMHVTKGSTLAFQPGVTLKFKSIKNVGLTGQPHELTEIGGSGGVWLQSMPYKRTKDRIFDQVGAYFGLHPKKINPVWGKK